MVATATAVTREYCLKMVEPPYLLHAFEKLSPGPLLQSFLNFLMATAESHSALALLQDKPG